MSTIRRRDFLAGFGAAMAASAMPRIITGAGRQPNVIYYIADELGYFELSCMGHPDYRTPHLDGMALEGVRLTQCLAGNAVCAPTRCCLLTGKHAGHASVRDNGTHQTLQKGEATLASMFKRAGYATGGFGKWGNGNRGSDGVPEQHGFDVFFGYYDQSHAHSYYPPYLIRNSRELPLPGNEPGLQLTGRTYSHYQIVAEAQRWIREHRDGPFFAYLAWTPPHGSFAVPEDDPSWRLYADKPWPREARVYAAMVNMIDRHFGEILQLLKELRLEDNTLVMFSGDNGGNPYFADDAHPAGFFAPNIDPRSGRRFRAGKGSLYEGGLRVPFIARWPGRIPPGRVGDQLCYFPDVMPTLAAATGVPCPGGIDGVSFLPALTGGSVPERGPLYWEFKEMTAVRIGQWKGIQPKKSASWELYDLAGDVEEKRNLASQHPQMLKEMEATAAAAHTPQPRAGVADRTLNAKDLQSVYPDRANSGVDPSKNQDR